MYNTHILPLLLLAQILPTIARPLQNTTLALPPGTTDHGTPGLLCTPTRATDILLFYLLNYVAHAATVLMRPGERADDYIVSVLGSLLFPALGLYRGIEALLCGALFVRNDELRRAARSGALCCVVRGADWRPGKGEGVHGALLKRGTRSGSEELGDGEVECSQSKGGEERIQSVERARAKVHITTFAAPSLYDRIGLPVYVHRRLIHGTHVLPEGYRFAILPHDTCFAPTTTFASGSSSASCRSPHVQIAATHNIPKSLLALAQSIYAVYTLYRARGDQIEQFGYAAFGLTVAPYAVMSIVNLLGSFCRPEYPALGMMESEIMEEARGRGGVFEGCVGRVVDGAEIVGCVAGSKGGELCDVVRWEVGGEDEVEVKVHCKDHEGNDIVLRHRHSIQEPILRRTLAPLTTDLDHRGTADDDILLIPSHPPISRSSMPPGRPSQHTMTSIRLKRVHPPFRHATWTPILTTSTRHSHLNSLRLLKHALTALISLLPFAIIGTLSRFHIGSIPPRESSTWRPFTVQWACIGALTGLWFVFDQERKEGMANERLMMAPWARAFSYVVSAAPAVGGYIVVGQMLSRFGACQWVGG